MCECISVYACVACDEWYSCVRASKAGISTTAPTNLFDKLLYVLNTVVSRCSKTLDRFCVERALLHRYRYKLTFQWIHGVFACDAFSFIGTVQFFFRFLHRVVVLLLPRAQTETSLSKFINILIIFFLSAISCA